MMASSPMMRLASSTGMSDCPRWTPSAPEAMATSTLSSTKKNLSISSAILAICLACTSISPPSACFILSCTASAPPS